MKRYFAVAFVVTAAFLAPSSGSALARGTARTLEPQVSGEAWAGESGVASYYGPTFLGAERPMVHDSTRWR
jgi:hypothetical protein